MVVLAGVVFGIGAGWWALGVAGNERAANRARETEEKNQREQAARAITSLAPGVQEAWEKYVDRRVAERVQVDGGIIKVIASDDRWRGGTTYVSKNSAYRVECNPIQGASVYFARGGEAGDVEVPISGSGQLFYGIEGNKEDTPPPMGVDSGSIAAQRLSAALCKRIAGRMEQVVGHPISQTPAAPR